MDLTKYQFPSSQITVPEPINIGVSYKWKTITQETLNNTLNSLVSCIADLRKSIAQRKISYSVQILDLNDPTFRLKSPIYLIISSENNEFYAECIEFDVYGVGKDEKEAIDDLKESLIVYYKTLIQSKGKIAKRLKMKRWLLKKIISHER